RDRNLEARFCWRRVDQGHGLRWIQSARLCERRADGSLSAVLARRPLSRVCEFQDWCPEHRCSLIGRRVDWRDEFQFDHNFSDDFREWSTSVQLGDQRRRLDGNLRLESGWLERAPLDSYSERNKHLTAMESENRPRDRFHIGSSGNTAGLRDGFERRESAGVDSARRPGGFALVVARRTLRCVHLRRRRKLPGVRRRRSIRTATSANIAG